MTANPLVVCGNFSDSPLAFDIGQLLGLPVDIADNVALKTFANSEFCPRFIPGDGSRPGRGLAGRTVLIVSSSSMLHNRNELAMCNLILARAAKENGAEWVMLVEPDLFYSAQDRGPYRFGDVETERGDEDVHKFNGQPFTARLYSELLKTAGVDEVVTVHNHSEKVFRLFKEAFEGRFHNLIPSEIFAHYILHSDFAPPGPRGRDLVLCAPDKGARAFVNQVAERLDLPEARLLVLDKCREGEREVRMTVSAESPCGVADLENKNVIILDDMVRTGTTIVQCCKFIKDARPRRVCFVVTHFPPSEQVRENLHAPVLDEILTTTTIPSILNRDCQGRLRHKLAVLKLGKWITRSVLGILGENNQRFAKDFYTVDMSSKNPRWAGSSAAKP
ncbi:MAG: phosphoribosyltransferase family protein [Planctomycetota bacterium]